MKVGVIDVGGGMRGIYAAGVLDTCLKQGVKFDYCMGISAGSANMVSYTSGQLGRNYKFYHDYSSRKEFMGLESFIRNGAFINLEYIYGTLTNSGGENPLDFDSILKNSADLVIVASDAETGKSKFFRKEDMSTDNYRVLMASCCVPVLNKPIKIGDSFYYDGAIANPIPLQQAFDDGCDKVVLLLTKPVDSIQKPGKELIPAKMIKHRFPNTAKNMSMMAERYNQGIELAHRYEKEGKVLIVAPDYISSTETFKRDKKSLDNLYKKGLKDGERISEWL